MAINDFWRRLAALALAWVLAWAAPASFAAENAKSEIEVKVKGAGFLRDRELRLALQRLLAVEEKKALDANALEDGAVILSSSLVEEGFQTPRIEMELTLADGSRETFVFDPTFATSLPRGIEARGVTFRLTRGVRSYVAQVEFNGLSAIDPKDARALFRTEATLLATAKANAYAPSRVTRAADALLDQLQQRGYAEAEVRAQKVGETNGAVTIRVEVKQGVPWEVAAVQYQRDEDSGVELPDPRGWVGRPWTTTLQENIREAIRHAYYRKGFPDVGVHAAREEEETRDGKKRARIVATIVPGSIVKMGQVRFKGNVTTRESVLRRRVLLETGDPLNVLAIERTRYRISRLGVFESVDLRYEPEEGEVRDPVFTVREGPRYETHLLAGYGSYERVRAGVEHRQMNIFGLAHQSRFELVQSMKSTNADYSYSVPELFGESLDGTARLFFLQREEIAFVRQEYGLNASLKRSLRAIGGDVSLGYTYGPLRNRDNSLSSEATDERQVISASVDLAITGDRRDNPLRPRHGYHWMARVEAADPTLGGEVTYQRYEVAGGYHTGWGSSRWIHVGLSHGFITTIGADDRGLPVNTRFYPGGDNSIRGYQRGEAAPRGADGRFIGAKSYGLLNVELEQALTTAWSVVAFVDILGTSPTLGEYPFSERLYSAGLGVRYNTLIGPVRLEYGRNIHRRPADPSGTLHFSIGYPF